MVVCICGEGNGTPLQYSRLENPMNGGAWWAVVQGVSKSWTRLKQLSSSTSCTYQGSYSRKQILLCLKQEVVYYSVLGVFRNSGKAGYQT